MRENGLLPGGSLGKIGGAHQSCGLRRRSPSSDPRQAGSPIAPPRPRASGAELHPEKHQAMSNTPDDPNTPKPGTEGQTPRKKTDVHKPGDSDSSIDMSIPAEGVESSGISVHEWAALVEEAPAESGSQVKFDSPSDADLL